MVMRESRGGIIPQQVIIWALVALLTQSAVGLSVFWEDLGDGPDSFNFAIITDLHITDAGARENLP